MLKKTICILSVLLLIFVSCVNAYAIDAADLSAASAVLYYPDGNAVLFEKNGREQRSMASTTKIMTSLIALEQCSPFLQTVITRDMVNVEGTSSGLREGDIISLHDLVYCMLLESGNDAANAVALTLADSFEDFAALMNDRAGQIGMKATSFVTPSGLDDEKHYTTAYDMALLAAEAVKNKGFASVCSKQKYTAEFIDSDKAVTLYNHNRLLSEYEGCIGMKTGFTKKSGRCLVSAAERDGVTLVAVTLNAPDDWNDHKKLLDYGFSLFKRVEIDNDFSGYSVPVTGSDTDRTGVSAMEALVSVTDDTKEITRRIYLERFLYAPVKKGDVVGYAEYIQDGRVIKKISLTAAESADKKEYKKYF